MRFWRSRTSLALVLTSAALIVPCGAWYIAGSREVRRTVEQSEAPLRQSANATARQLTQRLQDRLQTLLESESNRPFYQYQSLYHDPRGASEGPSVTPSPLAQGPADPLIRAYFQIDPSGRVSLPTLPETDLEGASLRQVAAQRVIQNELEEAARGSACVAFLQKGILPPRAPNQFLSLLHDSPSASFPPNSMTQTSSPPRYETMDWDAWIQNAQAARIYSYLKSGTNSAAAFANAELGQKDEQQKISIGVGEFEWCSLQISNVAHLVALRNVNTPAGTLVQGFVISNEGVAESLKNAVMPARFTPSAKAGSYVAAARLETTGWYIVVSAAKEFAAADAQARHDWLNFFQFFWAGAGAASVAGLCVVALVWNTERLARQRSQFAASAAHELRTPLAGLRMYSEMLADGLGDPKRARDYANRLAEEATRLGRVVSNVLEFTRLERGALQVRPEPGDLAATVRDCVEHQRPALEAAGVQVKISIPDRFPEARFDRDAIAEIVLNLLDNAEKYTRSATDRQIDIALSSDDDSVTLSVRDHGPGIPADLQGKIFRPFARGNRDDAPAGLGLGLALVKALARAHGGKVACANAPGGGALFTVTLPR
ncbi:MAG TPA: HAMP domain-containing sensor histidine kinase [Verrucomicrobiae bacterium]|nr:HAMP domain-containing sensor histidine kinase [Verrucomicrobiae bacterium]